MKLWTHGPTLGLPLLLLASGCRHKETFPDIGDKVASPVDVAVSDDGSHFYVLNADFDRTYDTGSLLVLDKDGNKVSTQKVPRMGRSLTVSGNDLLATIDYQDDSGKEPPHALMFDISDPAHPVLQFDLQLDCPPINAAMAKGYNYFAISCLDGSLWVGELTPDRHNSYAHKVRQWGVSRRALFMDKNRELLFGFTTDPGKEGLADEERRDCEKRDPVTSLPAAGTVYPNDTDCNSHAFDPNDVPDDWEVSKRALANTSQREFYQYFVYDIKAEKNTTTDLTNNDLPHCPPAQPCNFPFRYGDDKVAQSELRWLYFKLNNFDGSPDRSTYFNDQAYKYYRTNFFAARPDPDDPDVFYLSHRGTPDKSQFANDVVKVSLIGDPHAVSDHAGGWNPPVPNSSIMSFQRAYGFRGPEANRFVYTGDIQVTHVAGQKIIVVNNFRDLVTWVKGDRYFSLAGQTLDDNISWYNELPGDLNPTSLESYYQIAIAPSGRTLSTSFYGNAVILLDVLPGVDIKKINRIE